MQVYLKRSVSLAILLAVFSLLAITGGAVAAGQPSFPAKVGYPNSIASTGDSITRAFNTGIIPFTDAPGNSWSTGYSGNVNSHYLRILSANKLINGNTYNDAITGEQMVGLSGEFAHVISQNADYVTVLMGANDACTNTVSQMTPVSTYRAQFESAMQTLSTALPDSRIYVVSIPNIFNLWDILHTNQSADYTWTLLRICQSMLARPKSTAPGDMQRRQTVLQREMDYNTQLQQVCAEFIHCRFDGDAVFNTPFTPNDVNTRDYFHPNFNGQNLLASVSYGATYDFTDNDAPVSTAQVTPVPGGISVALSATDVDGISGIEYIINSGGWNRYTNPVFVASGDSITFRSVDLNGNIEASQTIVSP